MSNSYYSKPAQLARNTVAQAEAINDRDNVLDQAFGKLPTEAELKKGTVTYAVDTGAADAYAVTLPYPPTALTDGFEVNFRAINANTGASTLDVGLGAVALKRADNTPLVAGDIGAGSNIKAVYNPTFTAFVILSYAPGLLAAQVALATEQAELATTNGAAQVTLATEQKALAEAAAQTAINAPGTAASSTTSLAMPTTFPASISLTIQTGKALVPGMAVQIAYTTTPTTYMHGIITAYNSTTGALNVTVTATAGVVGTYADWTISLSAPASSGGGSDLANITLGII